MRYKNILALTILSLALCGCTPDQERVKIDSKVISETSVAFDGVKITKVGTFQDYSAYGSERCVYRIVDSKSGKEFIGISGVGISETGDHSSGKSRLTDER